MDREKVIKGQECCQISMSEENPFEKCEECPYNHIGISVQDCRSILSGDTLELLKEQEQKNVLGIADSIEGIEVGKCPRCDRTIVNKQSDPTRFCKYCGQAVKFE